MMEYLVCRISSYFPVEIKKARRLTEEEKKETGKGFRERAFVSLGQSIDLEYIDSEDVMKLLNYRESDGCFLGTSNTVYIISEEECDQLKKLDKAKKQEQETVEKERYIKVYRNIIEECEKQGKLYTDEEAHRARENYNNLHNEGGSGFIPHFYTSKEYEAAKSRLKELLPELKELEQAIKSFLVDEPEKTRDSAAYAFLCSVIANDPIYLAYLSLPKELEEKVKEYREYKIAENIVAPDSDAQEMPTIDDLCNALEKQGKKDLSDKIRRAQNQ